MAGDAPASWLLRKVILCNWTLELIINSLSCHGRGVSVNRSDFPLKLLFLYILIPYQYDATSIFLPIFLLVLAITPCLALSYLTTRERLIGHSGWALSNYTEMGHSSGSFWGTTSPGQGSSNFCCYSFKCTNVNVYCVERQVKWQLMVIVATLLSSIYFMALVWRTYMYVRVRMFECPLSHRYTYVNIQNTTDE